MLSEQCPSGLLPQQIGSFAIPQLAHASPSKLAGKAPVVLAPGRVFLVGEHTTEDGCAVVAAITRHAKAQFAHGADVAALVAEVTQRTRVGLAEVFAALPMGSLSVDVGDFRENDRPLALGSSVAAAVATIGALFETLGLSIANRKSMVLASAQAGRDAAIGCVEGDVDWLAATYGGLVHMKRQKGEVEIQAAPAPAGLHLVLFAAPVGVTAQQLHAGIERYARSDPASFNIRSQRLRELAQQVSQDLTAASVRSALAAARAYSDEHAQLASEAQVPLMRGSLALASTLARELGGLAKPTAGQGDVGVAMFASREAADKFREASAPYLSLLQGGIDRLGVRCQGPSMPHDEGPTDVELVSPEVFDASSMAVLLTPGPPTPEGVGVGQDLDRASSSMTTRVPARAPAGRRGRRFILLAFASLVAFAFGAELAGIASRSYASPSCGGNPRRPAGARTCHGSIGCAAASASRRDGRGLGPGS